MMPAKIARQSARMNFVLPVGIRDALTEVARQEQKSVAQVVREAIEQRVEEVRRREFEARLKEAYLGLAEENRSLAEEFRYVDSEHLGEWGEQKHGTGRPARRHRVRQS